MQPLLASPLALPIPERRATALERALVSVVAVGVIAALFLFRSHDDNRLTSWSWVFAGVHPAVLFGLAFVAAVLAHRAALIRIRRPALLLFGASFALGASFWSAPEAILDASRYFAAAKHLEVYGFASFPREWGRAIPAWTDLWLVPFLYGAVFRVFGESRIFVQAFTTLLFAGTVVVTYRLGKTLWNEEIGFAAGAFLLAIPYLPTQVPALLVDVPTMFFLTLAMLAIVRGPTPLAAVAVFLAFFSKYSVWILLPVVLLLAADRRRTLRIAFFSLLLIAPALWLKADVHLRQIELLLGYQAPGLGRWGESFASTFLFQIHPFLTMAALVSLFVGLRDRDLRYAFVAGPALLILQVPRIRYLVPIFPLLALMAAVGLQLLRNPEVRRTVLAAAVFSSALVALGGYLPFLRSVSLGNLEAAGTYLDSIDEPSAEVLAFSGGEINAAVEVPLLDLYTSKPLAYHYQRSLEKRDETSPLRFTWDYVNPRYYEGSGAAVVVIAEGAPMPLPLPGYRLAATFDRHEGVFRQRSTVAVWRRPREQP